VTAIGPVLQAFFTERLVAQRRASPHTVAAYRDTFCLLFGFLQAETAKAPSALQLEDIDADVLGRFLQHLERDRHNSVRTANARLTALRSFFRFAVLHHQSTPGRSGASWPCRPSVSNDS
jgi:integrase/recombinase XerD